MGVTKRETERNYKHDGTVTRDVGMTTTDEHRDKKHKEHGECVRRKSVMGEWRATKM